MEVLTKQKQFQKDIREIDPRMTTLVRPACARTGMERWMNLFID